MRSIKRSLSCHLGKTGLEPVARFGNQLIPHRLIEMSPPCETPFGAIEAWGHITSNRSRFDEHDAVTADGVDERRSRLSKLSPLANGEHSRCQRTRQGSIFLVIRGKIRAMIERFTRKVERDRRTAIADAHIHRRTRR